MKLYRVSNDSLRCILSAEDLEKYNIDIKDFVTQTNAATSFIRVLMQKAEEEIGYQSTHGIISLKVMQMPDKNLCLTITETPETDLKSQLIRSVSEILSGVDHNGDEAKELIEKLVSDNAEDEQESSDDRIPEEAVILVFRQLNDVIDFASRVRYRRHIESELYLMPSRQYMLVIHKGKMAEASFQKVVSLASEFCTEITRYTNDGAVLREHGEVLIKEKAVSALKKIK